MRFSPLVIQIEKALILNKVTFRKGKLFEVRVWIECDVNTFRGVIRDYHGFPSDS